MKLKTYSELIKYDSFIDRFNYLTLDGIVGIETFGFDRYLNQALYRSAKWRRVRNDIIIRDCGCDLGVEGYEIPQHIIIHHMNPISMEQIQNRDPMIFDPEFLITTQHKTHNAIHYGDESLLPKGPIERRMGDTCPWKVY